MSFVQLKFSEQRKFVAAIKNKLENFMQVKTPTDDLDFYFNA